MKAMVKLNTACIWENKTISEDLKKGEIVFFVLKKAVLRDLQITEASL